MRKIRITIDVPIVDLPDDERAELLKQQIEGLDKETRDMILEEGLPTLADYLDDKDESLRRIAEAIINPILWEMQEGGGEMFAGSELYVTVQKDAGPELIDADWVPE